MHQAGDEVPYGDHVSLWRYYDSLSTPLPWIAVDAALTVQGETEYDETKDRLAKLQFEGLFKALRTALRRTGGSCSTTPGEGDVWRLLTVRPVYLGANDEHPELVVALPHWGQPRVMHVTDWSDRYEYALCGYHPFFRALFIPAQSADAA